MIKDLKFRLLVLDIDLEVNQDLGQLYNLFNQMKR